MIVTEPVPVSLVDAAASFAHKKHAGQARKFEAGPVPYITHPVAVAARLDGLLVPLIDAGEIDLASVDAIVAAAYLHDVVEDCGVGIQEIRERFGARVAGLVEEMTSDKAEADNQGKARYLAAKVNKMSEHARWIKLADREDNVRGLGRVAPGHPDFVRRYAAETAHVLDKWPPGGGTLERDLLASIRTLITPHL